MQILRDANPRLVITLFCPLLQLKQRLWLRLQDNRQVDYTVSCYFPGGIYALCEYTEMLKLADWDKCPTNTIGIYVYVVI